MSFVIFAVFAVSVVLLFRLFRLPRNGQAVYKPLYELHLQHQSVHYRLVGVGLLAGAVAGLGSYLLLPAICDLRLSYIPQKEYTFRPAAGAFRTAAIFLGLYIGTLVALYWGKRRLKDKWAEYLVYQSLRYKGLSPAPLKVSVIVLGLLAGAASLAATDHFIAFTTDSIVVKSTFSPRVHRYTYDQLEEIRQVETFTSFTGTVVYDPHAVLLFTDERNWNFRSEGLSPRPEEKEFIPWLLRRTGKKLVQLEAE
ncbi:hypothetical protein [Paraflavitalea pollutisoli]|uniref:hypothetical protein n=1 Tax=Paraflavitalea pollutisoli TaxID=3034143 RepID=UPI0023EC5272|nr:hypothetical protein [Paraflavitalea sp. H1-2-19X]